LPACWAASPSPTRASSTRSSSSPRRGGSERRPRSGSRAARLDPGEYNRPVMIDLVLRKVFGSKHERDVKRMRPRVTAINALEAEIGRWPDEAFRARADEFRQKLQDGTELDEILPEVFAMVREIGRRRLGMRHFDVQFMGGMVLHEGKIAEMATGEGKTLVA